ncbi:hypothetical protein [Aquimarina algicola]|uniref:Uncharacterized protein n=1 Tax=Aquimarina algicola TaxID=2589995 RepID=A0A504JH38_9FLAO|nr:hypothetical protein [Aquimarina algicola]TPN87098.1 hypothetical protein FHK87_05770 [Aquimarina algicola]
MNSIKERRIIKKMVKELSGLTNPEIFDILYKTERLFNVVKDPEPKIIDAILFSLDNPHDIPFDGSFYLLTDYTYNLRIFITSYPVTLLSVFRNNYYFKTAYCSNPKKFTKKNVLKSFKDTSMEIYVFEFLKRNKLRKRNPKTKRFQILEYLHKIEC